MNVKELNRKLKSGHVKLKPGQSVPGVRTRKRSDPPPDVQTVAAGQIRAGMIIGLDVVMPIRIESEMNRRDHPLAVAGRKQLQKQEVRAEFRRLFYAGFRVEMPAVVTLTRIAPTILDDDNLRCGFKAVRDALASILDVDDGDPLVTWDYKQYQSMTAGYGIRIQIQRPFETGHANQPS